MRARSITTRPARTSGATPVGRKRVSHYAEHRWSAGGARAAATASFATALLQPAGLGPLYARHTSAMSLLPSEGEWTPETTTHGTYLRGGWVGELELRGDACVRCCSTGKAHL